MPNMIKSISHKNGRTLKALDLTGCYQGMNFESTKSIIDNCLELEEINFCLTNLSQRCVYYLADNLTNKIVKLGLRNLDLVRDEHVKQLVSRCNKLATLDLSFTSVTNNSINSIVQHLEPI